MNHSFLYLLLTGLLFSCSNNGKTNSTINKPDEWQYIKHSTNLDAIGEYIESIPSNQYFDSAVDRYFEVLNVIQNGAPPWKCSNNCCLVMTNQNETVLFEGRVISIDSLKVIAHQFLADTNSSNHHSSNTMTLLDYSGFSLGYSTGHFAVVINPDSAPHLKEVVVGIRGAIEDYKSDIEQNLNRHGYNVKRSTLDSLFKKRIMLWDYKVFPEPAISLILEQADSIEPKIDIDTIFE